MKRVFVAITVALLAGSLADPAAAVPVWTLGFKAGLAVSNLKGSDVVDDVGHRTAFAGGGFAQVDVSENFGIRLEALYHMKGASEDSSGVSATIKVDYLEFPILLVAQTPVSEGVRVGAFAGPVVAFNTSAKIAGSAGGFSAAVDIKDYIASFEFALAFGLGASFDAGSATITLDGRYQLGLTTIDDGLGGNTADTDVKNRGWAFLVGVGFPVGGH
jgi:hypothetical protein